MRLGLSVTGLRQAQAANVRLIKALDPRNEMGAITQRATLKVFYKMRSLVHRQSGTLAAALTVDFKATARTATGSVYIDTGVVNPRSGAYPAFYGPLENARGGSHAFIDRTYAEFQQAAADAAADMQNYVNAIVEFGKQ